jgi:hypothetical protein
VKRTASSLPLLPLLALVVPASAARADDVHLVGGGKVSGEIVERTADKVVVETGPGRVTLPLSRVKRIEVRPSLLAEFRARARAIEPADAAAWVALGRWAEQRDLGTQAQEAYQRALAADPGNDAANRALGRVRSGDRWLTREESYREQGLVPHEGDWVTPAERDASARERAEAERSTQARREAEARAREAEARARAAEAEASRAEAEATSGASEGIPYWPYLYPGGSVIVPAPPACCDEPEPETAPPPRPAPPPPTTSIHEDDASGASSSRPRPKAAPEKAVPRGARPGASEGKR